jgi:hypothetical protein
LTRENVFINGGFFLQNQIYGPDQVRNCGEAAGLENVLKSSYMNFKSNKLTGLKNKSALPLLTLLLAGAILSGPGWGARALAGTYTNRVNCPATPAVTPFALQLYAGATPDPLGELLNTVLPVNFAADGSFDGCIVDVPQYDTAGYLAGFKVYTIDSTLGGWADASDSFQVPPPRMKLGDGAVFVNNSGGALTLTFSGNAMSTPVNRHITPNQPNSYHLLGSQIYNPANPSGPYTFHDITGEDPSDIPGDFSVYVFTGLGFDPSTQPGSFFQYQWNSASSSWSPSVPTVGLGRAVWIGPPNYSYFPPLRGDDNVFSLGQFQIVVNPDFQAMMVNYPGYNSTTKQLTSPMLYEAQTIIGRSAALHKGSAQDFSGVLVGTAGVNVSDSMLTVEPGGLEPVGTREVHTRIQSLNMTDGNGVAVRAGINALDQPDSVGEVESYSGAAGLPGFDFPAQSFFDMYVDVDLPAGGTGFPGATLYNSLPLLVQNLVIGHLPPEVTYIHGMSTAVPITFRSGTYAGQILGLLVLAGHGVFDPSNSAAADLESALAATPPAPVEPAYANWAPGLTVAGTNMIFPPKGDDHTASLGRFILAVNPIYQSLVSSRTNWNPATKLLTSPLLFDPATVIGRSAPLTEGSITDAVGVLVGTANTLVGDANITLVPPLFESPSNTFELKTEMRSLNLTDGGGYALRAGIAAPGTPGSYGEVESLSGASGDPYWDFPAKGFTDMFVQMDFPANSPVPAFTVTNGIPLIVQNNNLTKFPPKVVYVHGNTTAVPVYFTNTTAYWHAGDVFGIILLAGHGVNYTNVVADVTNFTQVFAQMIGEPVAPQYATWAVGLNVPLQISGTSLINGNVQFNGYCTAGNSVTLQSADTLINPTWVNVTTTTGTANGTFTAVTTKSTASVKFYRMVDNTR